MSDPNPEDIFDVSQFVTTKFSLRELYYLCLGKAVNYMHDDSSDSSFNPNFYRLFHRGGLMDRDLFLYFPGMDDVPQVIAEQYNAAIDFLDECPVGIVAVLENIVVTNTLDERNRTVTFHFAKFGETMQSAYPKYKITIEISSFRGEESAKINFYRLHYRTALNGGERIDKELLLAKGLDMDSVYFKDQEVRQTEIQHAFGGGDALVGGYRRRRRIGQKRRKTRRQRRRNRYSIRKRYYY